MTLFALAIALPLVAAIWYPDWLPAAAIVGAVLAACSLAAAIRAPKARPGWVSAPQARSRSRWLPGFGLGLGFWPHIHPTLILGLFRWRR